MASVDSNSGVESNYTRKIFEIHQTHYGNSNAPPEPKYNSKWLTNIIDLEQNDVEITYFGSISVDDGDTKFKIEGFALVNIAYSGKPINARLIRFTDPILTKSDKILFIQKLGNLSDFTAEGVLEACRDSNILSCHFTNWLAHEKLSVFFSVYYHHQEALDLLINITGNQLLDDERKLAPFHYNHPSRHAAGTIWELFIPYEKSLEVASASISEMNFSITPQPPRNVSVRLQQKYNHRVKSPVGMFHFHYYIVVIFGYIFTQ